MNTLLRVLFLSLLSATAYAAPPDTVMGAWELCVDPDGDPKDVIELDANGTGKVINADGRTLSLTHVAQGSSVTLTVALNGRTLGIPLTVSSDKKKLSKFNKESKTTSYYVRRGNPDQFACTAK